MGVRFIHAYRGYCGVLLTRSGLTRDQVGTPHDHLQSYMWKWVASHGGYCMVTRAVRVLQSLHVVSSSTNEGKHQCSLTRQFILLSWQYFHLSVQLYPSVLLSGCVCSVYSTMCVWFQPALLLYEGSLRSHALLILWSWSHVLACAKLA